MFWLIVLAAFGGLGYYMYNLNKQDEIDEAQDWGDNPQGQLRRVKIGKKWRMVSSSSTLIEGANGKQEKLMELIKAKLQFVAVPDIRTDERLVSFAGIYDMFANERRMFVVQNKKFRGYYLFVSAHDYGKQLDVVWRLMLRENWLTRLLRHAEQHIGLYIPLFPVVILAKYLYASSRTTLPELMHIFEAEELSCFCTTVHHAVQQAVGSVLDDLNLNSADVNWQTRGFLSLA
jgi:hypothetical protein